MGWKSSLSQKSLGNSILLSISTPAIPEIIGKRYFTVEFDVTSLTTVMDCQMRLTVHDREKTTVKDC